MELKDKAKAKEERRAAKRTEERTTKGPQIAWDEAVQVIDSPLGPTPPPVDSSSDNSGADPATDPTDDTTD